MRQILAILALAACSVSTHASAQTPSPIVQHYRAYQAALERNDLAAAETAAAAALAAAEAATDRRTGILALNLASVRINRADWVGALAPAQRAHTLAQAGTPNLSPVLAGIILGRAEMGNGNLAGAERVTALLPNAEAEGVAAEEIYDAAVDLGDFTFRRERFVESEAAWAIAQNNADASRLHPAYAGGRARVRRASAMALASLRNDRRFRIEETAGREAYILLAEAIRMLMPVAMVEAPSGEVTIGQQAYGEALAWQAALGAKLRLDGIDIPEIDNSAQMISGQLLSEIGASRETLTRPRCRINIRLADGSPNIFPPGDMEENQLAGIAIRFRVNAEGRVIEQRPIATLGDVQFARAVERANWVVEPLDGSQPDCRMEMIVFQSISFMIN